MIYEMKVLPGREFEELAKKQEYGSSESVSTLAGFIDKYTYEPVVRRGASTRLKLHELGHRAYEHMEKAIRFYGKGKKNILLMRQTWASRVDEEIEAEMYSFRLRGKKITYRVGLMALRELIAEDWEPHKALGLVIGRLKKYGIEVSWKDRMDMAKIIERLGIPIEGYEDL